MDTASIQHSGGSLLPWLFPDPFYHKLVTAPHSLHHNAVDHTKKACAGQVGKMMTLSGELRFPNLYCLMAGLLSIPCSNADAERGFSVLRKVHTDQRVSLSHETLVHLFSIKFYDTSCCFDTEHSEELIAKCKKATRLSLNKK